MLSPGQFQFSVVRQLGQGGLGTVDEIEVVETNRAYAVGTRLARKRLNSAWAAEPRAIERFEREIAAIKIMSHPNILPYKGENLASGPERFYVMPVYPQTLRGLLYANRAGFGWIDVARFGARIAQALQYAHSCGFIHRDIKPENILIDAMGNPVIADWGLGYFIHKESRVLVQLTRGGMGTEYYCSLEQWNTGKCGGTGDVYSLGITLAELATGVQNAIEHVGAGLPQPVVPNNDLGAIHFNAVIGQMTDLLATRRIQTMEAVAQALIRAADIGSNFR